MNIAVRTLRLTCSEFYVDARLTAVEGRWLAPADTPDGPSVGHRRIADAHRLAGALAPSSPAIVGAHVLIGPSSL